MTDYVAVHRIERRPDPKKLEITNPGDPISLSGDEETSLLALGAVRLPKGDAAPAAPAETAKPLSVAEIKAAVVGASRETLDTLLAAEQAGGNRTTAVKAIEDAIAALPADEDGEGDEAKTEDGEGDEAKTEDGEGDEGDEAKTEDAEEADQAAAATQDTETL